MSVTPLLRMTSQPQRLSERDSAGVIGGRRCVPDKPKRRGTRRPVLFLVRRPTSAAEERVTSVFEVGNRCFSPWKRYLRGQDTNTFDSYDGRGQRIHVVREDVPTHHEQLT